MGIKTVSAPNWKLLNTGEKPYLVTDIKLRKTGSVLKRGKKMSLKNYQRVLFLLLTAISLTAVSVIPVKAAFGDLDPTFGFNGAVYSHLQLNQSKLARQSDGKFLETGRGGSEQIYVRRFNANGTLDTSFGSSGYAIPYSSVGYINNIAIQSDGKIVVCGTSGSAYYVWRFNANGTHDSGFGTNGRAFIYSNPSPYYDHYNAVSVFKPSSTSSVESIIVATHSGSLLTRLNSNGTLNTSFGTNGSIGFSANVRFLTRSATQFQNASIYVTWFGSWSPQQSLYLSIRRYTANGQFDAGFGASSLYSNSPIGWHASVAAFKMTNQGKFVIGATIDDGGPATSVFYTIVGLHASDGTLENVEITPTGATDWVKAIGVNSDNTILFGGANFMRKFSADLTVLQNNISIPVESFLIQPDGKFVVSTPGVIRRYLQ